MIVWLFISMIQIIDMIGIHEEVKPRGLLVIPGLGRADRLDTVVHNVKLIMEPKFEMHKIEWDCVIYVYTSRTDESFWSNKEKLNYVSQFCKIIENPGKKVTENLYMLQPSLIYRSYKYVFILLDDIKLDRKDPNTLNSLYSLLLCNNLTVVSPLVRTSSTILHNLLII